MLAVPDLAVSYEPSRTAAVAECCAPLGVFIINVLVDVHDLEVPWNKLIIWWDDFHDLDILRSILLLTIWCGDMHGLDVPNFSAVNACP